MCRGEASTAAMTKQNAKCLKRKQRLARFILQTNHWNNNSNIKGLTDALSPTETSYLFGNTACCIAWAPNTHTQSEKEKCAFTHRGDSLQCFECHGLTQRPPNPYMNHIHPPPIRPKEIHYSQEIMFHLN
jgi:hypothetical protein